jgi:DNA repair exonuclease SbcCD ATPase subunit
MGFRFFKKSKVEVITLDEAERKLLEIIKEREKALADVISQKLPEMRECANKLILELEKFDSSSLYPRLKGVARSFKSAMLDLWKDSDFADFEEIARKMEKVAVMKVKHFRLLFAVNPPEIKQISRYLKEIAATIKVIEERKMEIKIEELKKALESLKTMKKILNEKEKLSEKFAGILAEIERIKTKTLENNKSHELRGLEKEITGIERRIQERERDVQKKIALARKPLKIYAHMVGERLDLNLKNPELSVLASKAATEIVKGSIKLKEKNLKAVVHSLESISRGEIREELEGIDALKKRLAEGKEKIRKIQIEIEAGKDNRERTLRKEFSSIEDRIKRLDKKRIEARKVLEKQLYDIFGETIKLSN